MNTLSIKHYAQGTWPMGLRILITQTIAKRTAQAFPFANFPFQNQKADPIDQEIFANIHLAKINDLEIIYAPGISERQSPDEENDRSLVCFCALLMNLKPDVVVVGNNALPHWMLAAWRTVIGKDRSLLVVRRGVDMRAIDLHAAKQLNIAVKNLPAINAPFVARHILKNLRLETAKNPRATIIGSGHIGTYIAKETSAQNIPTTIYSPSLVDAITRDQILKVKGLDALNLNIALTLEEAFANATHVAIAVPLFRSNHASNANMIDKTAIAKSAHAVRIVSCSHPDIFSKSALIELNRRALSNSASTRIDTAKRHAEYVKTTYPNIETAYNQAFADPECQYQLDEAMLQAISQHYAQSQASEASAS